MILAIETSTPVCSVALQATDGSVFEKRESGRGIHSEKLFEFVEELFADHTAGMNDIDELLLSSGPGSYTGLRIGSAAVKGLLFRKNPRLFLLGSLEAMALGAVLDGSISGDEISQSGRANSHSNDQGDKDGQSDQTSNHNRVIHAVIDARRKHLYYQRFEFSEKEVTKTAPGVHLLADIETKLKSGDVLTGTGIERLNLNRKIVDEITIKDGESAVSAVHLIAARNHPIYRSWFSETDPASFEPEYLAMGQADK